MLDHNLPVVCTVRAIYAFMAREEGDLTLNKGDIIQVHDNDGGWWKGTLLPDCIYGSFPSNFVEIINSTDELNQYAASPSSPRSQLGQHSRQASVDSSKFTKRKPVNTLLVKQSACSTTSLSYSGSANFPCATLSAAAPSRKNPQAILGDMTDLDTIAPSSPISTTKRLPSQQEGLVSRRNSQNSVKSNQSRFSQLSSHISQILGASTSRRQSSSNDGAATPRKRVNGASNESVMNTTTQGSTVPDANPSSIVSRVEPTIKMVNEAMYNPAYAKQRQQRLHQASGLLNPSGPETDGAMSPSQANNGRHLSNRYSMPNLAGDNVTQQQQQPHSHQQQQQQYDTGFMAMTASNPGTLYIQDATRHGQSRATGTQSACHLPRGNMSGANLGQHENHNNSPSKQELPYEHNYSGDSQLSPPGMMPRSPAENRSTQGYDRSYDGIHSIHPFQHGQPDVRAYGQHEGSQQVVSAYHGSSPYQQQALQQQHGYRHSIANFGVPSHDQPTFAPGYRPTHHSALSLENLVKHNRTQNTLDQTKSHSVHSGPHERSLSQVNMRPSGSAVFNPYDHHQQQHQREQSVSAPMDQMSHTTRSAGPSIVIPQPKPRPRSAFANYGTVIMSPTDSSPASDYLGMLTSPRTPTSAQSNGTGTPTSVGTSMSRASAFAMKDQRRKSETARLPSNVFTTASTFTARKFSADAKGLLSGATRSASTGAPTTATATANATSYATSEASESLEYFGPYTAKKPKATLIRAFKQILNPRKVAEKDALKNKNEHFAWIEMQKSLRRAHSPEPEKETPFFALPSRDETVKEIQDPDPFDVLKRCHVMRDTLPTPGVTSGMLDFGPNSFVQVDKIARNVNQRGPHMTPQLLSQKYLTRPYSKSPLFKLRVLFVWISENIRLEGGPTRDVSGGRHKLGPASDNISALAEAGGGDSPSLWQVGGSTNSPGMFMTGIEEYARGFLQEGSPELAQDVLTRRMCKSGEGFANLFAEMALAAGIEDVGVVKGYIKGPMDVFSKDIPPPNHAWNVVRIDGTYRFIDCCLASPFHPAHYQTRPQAANSFYFLTLPTDLVLSHFPLFLTYQYIAPLIPPQVFLQLPFVQPAFFEFGLSLPDFKRRTKLDIKDHEPIEVVVRIDGTGNCFPSAPCGPSGGQSQGAEGNISGLLGGDCLGRGCGEGIELKAEVEVMTTEGKIIRKRGLAQVVILNPYQHLLPANQSLTSSQHHQHTQSKPSPMSVAISPNTGVASAVTTIVASSNRPYQSHHCTGIRIAKIKAVLPPETVVCPGGVRKGVVHIYAGRKAEKAPTDAMPYALALSLPIRHTGTMPKTPLNFVLPHFSPYEFYVKSPQTELLYYPHIYKFCVLSLAAQANAVIATANATIGEDEMVNGVFTVGDNTSPRHMKAAGGGFIGLSSSMAPLYRPQGTTRGMSTVASASAQTLASPPPVPQSSTATSLGTVRGAQYGNSSHPYQHRLQSNMSMASTSSASVNGGRNGGSDAGANGLGGSGLSIPRLERLMLRTQTNRLYKFVYDPVRQCHEAQVEVKERGIWECVRMDDGGKSRVGREGTGGVVIASWKCV